MTLKFNKLLKSATTDQSATSLLGIVRTFCAVHKVWRWRSQVFTSWCGKIQTDFLFSKIAAFLMYRQIYMYIYLRSSNSVHSILASVLCKTWSNIVWNYMLWVSGYFCRTMWYLSANLSKVIHSRWRRFLFIRMLSFFQTF